MRTRFGIDYSECASDAVIVLSDISKGVALNVLMLGWELPPYNSGGLGTACLGLTEGLANHDVDINFVVPKVFGTLPFNHMKVVSAIEYGGEGTLQKILAREDITAEEIASQLAYGATATETTHQQLTVEHVNNKRPVAPHVQAHWYAQQAGAIAEEHPDFHIVHGHDWFTYYGGIEARRVAAEQGRAVPFVAHVHATEIDRSSVHGDPRIVAIEHTGLHAADRVIAVSHYTKRVIHDHYGVAKSKISVVHNGIPERQPERFDFFELKKHHKIVLFMGRLTMQKGPDYFVKLAKAVTDVDPSVRFVMVGSGDMEKRCIEEAAHMGLTGKILFSSFLRGKDVDRAYQLADLFVMPSVSEPFGIVALEALQNGTPVLASSRSGVAEVSQHVITADFWDIPAMRNAVLKTINDPHFHSHLVRGGQEDLRHLSWHNAARKLKAVYEDVLAGFNPAVLQPAPVSVRS